jgi:riboflavin synthase
MFTGLIEEIGEVVAVEQVAGGPEASAGVDSIRLTIAGPVVTSDATHGASICVSGVCLTVVEQGVATDDEGATRGTFSADVMRQSLRMSTLGELQPGSRVNLERAMRADTRLGGHIVQGHVDGTATLFSLSPELAPLLVDKGSVTLSGVSLTVSAISDPPAPGEPGDGQWFEVSLIPETLSATTLGALEPGDRVNVETDILARHLARMRNFFTTTEGISE